MSSWLEDIGSARFSAKDIKLIIGVLKLMIEVSSEEPGDNEKQELLDKLDNAAYNVATLRKAVEKI